LAIIDAPLSTPPSSPKLGPDSHYAPPQEYALVSTQPLMVCKISTYMNISGRNNKLDPLLVNLSVLTDRLIDGVYGSGA
jgi:hypothetical protein